MAVALRIVRLKVCRYNNLCQSDDVSANHCRGCLGEAIEEEELKVSSAFEK